MRLKQTVRTRILDLCRGINDLRTDLDKDDKGDLFEDFDSILNGLKDHFCQLLSVHGVNDFRQTTIHLSHKYPSQVP
jgi:hypothetical protein